MKKEFKSLRKIWFVIISLCIFIVILVIILNTTIFCQNCFFSVLRDIPPNYFDSISEQEILTPFQKGDQITILSYINKRYDLCDSVKYYQRKYKDRGVGFHTEFQRSIINRTPMEIEDWKLQMKAWIDDIGKDNERNFFKKACKDTSCSSFNRVCQYANICKSSKGMEVDEQIVEAMYEFDDPYAYLNETLETERSKQNG